METSKGFLPFLKAEGVLPVTMRMDFAAGSIRLLAKKDPNAKQQPFLATITYAGAVSDGAVGGTEDIQGGPYRVYIPVTVMTARVDSLINKGVFVAESLDTHEASTRCGAFLDSWLERIPGTEIHDVRASGLIDHSSIEEDLMARIIDRARAGELGFSYDIKDISYHLDDSIIQGEKVCVVDDFKWRGATILRREAAAYQWTRLAAARPTPEPAASVPSSQLQITNSEDTNLDEAKLKALLEAALAPTAVSIAELKTKITAIEAKTAGLQAPQQQQQPQQAQNGTFDMNALGTVLATTMATAMTAAVKPIVDEIKAAAAAKTGEGNPGEGKRVTFNAAQLGTVSRYNSQAEEPGSLEAIEAAIETVKTAAKGRAQEQALNVLVPMKRQLLKAGVRQNFMQGVN